MKVDVIYLAHGRPEFTGISFKSLLANTDWSRVNALTVYGDGEPFQLPPFISPVSMTLRNERLGGPVAVLNHALQNSSADYVCKIDNDVMVPPGWWLRCVALLDGHMRGLPGAPPIDLLGIEPWAPDTTVFSHVPPARLVECEPGLHQLCFTRNIGGIGFFRRAAFQRCPSDAPMEWHLPTPNGRYGLTEWQWAHPRVVRGFIDPPLPVFLLDHHPAFRELNARYDAEGQQRRVWGEYPPEMSWLWEWWDAKGATQVKFTLFCDECRPFSPNFKDMGFHEWVWVHGRIYLADWLLEHPEVLDSAKAPGAAHERPAGGKEK